MTDPDTNDGHYTGSLASDEALDALRKKLTGHSERRHVDAEVVRLGHWEQMQFALALAFVREVLPTLDREEREGRWSNLNADYFREVEWLFQAGLTSITYEEPKE